MDLYKELPPLEFIIDLRKRGKRTNVLYKGKFTCKIPDNNDLAEADKRRALMTVGLDENLDVSTRLWYEKLSFLQCIILDAPDWWKQSKRGANILDADIIAELYDRAVEEEEKWKKAVWGDAPEVVSEEASDVKPE